MKQYLCTIGDEEQLKHFLEFVVINKLTSNSIGRDNFLNLYVYEVKDAYELSIHFKGSTIKKVITLPKSHIKTEYPFEVEWNWLGHNITAGHKDLFSILYRETISIVVEYIKGSLVSINTLGRVIKEMR